MIKPWIKVGDSMQIFYYLLSLFSQLFHQWVGEINIWHNANTFNLNLTFFRVILFLTWKGKLPVDWGEFIYGKAPVMPTSKIYSLFLEHLIFPI